LGKLANKQWHTYEKPSAGTSAQVTAYITRTWRSDDLLSTEALLFIIGCLGLTDAMLFLLSNIEASAASFSVRRAVREASQEFGPIPLDPYYGMPKKDVRS
jgi:hypothetical protein